ncbi:hypothetical protein KBA73_02400 [Patescibacteria group bacterium]|nr:hypothetical protein [Patescibacteria group bacterium]
MSEAQQTDPLCLGSNNETMGGRTKILKTINERRFSEYQRDICAQGSTAHTDIFKAHDALDIDGRKYERINRSKRYSNRKCTHTTALKTSGILQTATSEVPQILKNERLFPPQRIRIGYSKKRNIMAVLRTESHDVQD